MKIQLGKGQGWSLAEFTSPFEIDDCVTGVFLDRGVEKIESTPHQKISCPLCQGKKGYRVRNGFELWWCCITDECNEKIALAAIRRKHASLKMSGAIPSVVNMEDS